MRCEACAGAFGDVVDVEETGCDGVGAGVEDGGGGEGGGEDEGVGER